MKKDNVVKIVVTGPESSGKSTVATWLSQSFSAMYVEEVARVYLANRNEAYTPEDVRSIARLQLKAEADAVASGKVIICDTDLLTILIWQQEKFGQWDTDLYQSWVQSKPHLFILCAPDIPWTPDPLRENPDDRDRLFNLHHKLLLEHSRTFRILRGEGEDRLNFAAQFIKEFFET